MIADRAGNLELGADAVGTGDQHRVFVIAGEQPVGKVEAEKAREPTIEREDAGAGGPAQQFRQPGHRLAIDVQIDAGIFIGDFRHGVFFEDL